MFANTGKLANTPLLKWLPEDGNPVPKHIGVDIYHKQCITEYGTNNRKKTIFHNTLFTCCIKYLLLSFDTFQYSLTYWDIHLPLQFYEILPICCGHCLQKLVPHKYWTPQPNAFHKKFVPHKYWTPQPNAFHKKFIFVQSCLHGARRNEQFHWNKSWATLCSP